MWMLLAAAALAAGNEGVVTVFGQVTDASGQVLPVRTEVDGLLVGAASLSGCPGTHDAVRIDGSFSFALDEKSPCVLVATAPGFASWRLDLADYDGRELQIRLRPDGSPTEPMRPQPFVVVPAVPAPAPLVPDLGALLGQAGPVVQGAARGGEVSSPTSVDPAALLELLQQGDAGISWPGGAELPAEAPDLEQILDALEQLQQAL
jgi:hypothetical protein